MSRKSPKLIEIFIFEIYITLDLLDRTSWKFPMHIVFDFHFLYRSALHILIHKFYPTLTSRKVKMQKSNEISKSKIYKGSPVDFQTSINKNFAVPWKLNRSRVRLKNCDREVLFERRLPLLNFIAGLVTFLEKLITRTRDPSPIHSTSMNDRRAEKALV